MTVEYVEVLYTRRRCGLLQCHTLIYTIGMAHAPLHNIAMLCLSANVSLHYCHLIYLNNATRVFFQTVWKSFGANIKWSVVAGPVAVVYGLGCTQHAAPLYVIKCITLLPLNSLKQYYPCFFSNSIQKLRRQYNRNSSFYSRNHLPLPVSLAVLRWHCLLCCQAPTNGCYRVPIRDNNTGNFIIPVHTIIF